jgi:hypothetical protein
MDFKSFDEMMEKLGGVKFDGRTSISKDDDAEEVGGYLALFAHSGSVKKAEHYAKMNKLFIVTESIYDSDNGDVVYSYSSGIHYVNRERFFFVKKDVDFIFEEQIDVDN